MVCSTKNRSLDSAILFLIRVEFFPPLPPTLIDHPVGAFLHNVEALARDILYEFTLKLYECLFITKNENVRPIKTDENSFVFLFRSSGNRCLQ